MLRLFLLIIACLLLITGALIGFNTVNPGWIFFLWGILLLIGTLFERYRYKHINDQALGTNFIATGERFVDPETNEWIKVMTDPKTGERIYVQDKENH